MPYGSRLSHLYRTLAGNSAETTLKPSRGETGNKLNIANDMLIIIKGIKNTATTSLSSVENTLKRKFDAPKMIASAILATGPAAEVIAVSTTGLLKLYGLIGTGLLHPKRNNNKDRAPIGSMCANGLRVRRLFIFGVGSPSFVAVSACANSCTVDDIKTARPYIIMVKKDAILKLLDKSEFM